MEKTTMEPAAVADVVVKSDAKQPSGRVSLVEVSKEIFEAANGWSMRREYGKTPSGNSIGGRWVLRCGRGEWLDFDTYRHDLMERNGLVMA